MWETLYIPHFICQFNREWGKHLVHQVKLSVREKGIMLHPAPNPREMDSYGPVDKQGATKGVSQ